MTFKTEKGFSLIELVAVLAIISIMLFFTLPRFDVFSQTDDIRGVSRWLIATVPQLKAKAVSEQKPYVLIADLDQNAFLIETENPPVEITDTGEAIGTEEAVPETVEYKLSDNVTITDVIYPEQGVVLSGQVGIGFYAKGYSDRAIIHVTDADNNRLSFLIEPFLNRVELYDGHLDFGQALAASGLR